jgi:hypothetical protein
MLLVPGQISPRLVVKINFDTKFFFKIILKSSKHLPNIHKECRS